MKHAAPGSRRRSPRSPRPDPAAPPRVRLGQLPYLIVLCGAILSLLLMRSSGQYVRSGTLGLAGVFLAAAVARLLLPERRAGMLGSRHRLADVAAFGTLGIGLLVAGTVLAPP